jgi:predicted RNA-binding Zn-ribbon protein involved in translation (DUF1610 family)
MNKAKVKARNLVERYIAKNDQSEEARLDEAQLATLGANKTALIFDNLTVYFSYATPVAVYKPREGTIFVTAKKWSPTTSKHINQFIADSEAENTERVPQADLDKMVDTMSIREAVDAHAAAQQPVRGRNHSGIMLDEHAGFGILQEQQLVPIEDVRPGNKIDYDGDVLTVKSVYQTFGDKMVGIEFKETGKVGQLSRGVNVRVVESVTERGKNYAPVTPGMSNKLKGMPAARKCNSCGNTVPKYKGRYPNECPECGHPLVKAESETPILDKYLSEAGKKSDDDKKGDDDNADDTDDEEKKNGKGKKAPPFPPKKKGNDKEKKTESFLDQYIEAAKKPKGDEDEMPDDEKKKKGDDKEKKTESLQEARRIDFNDEAEVINELAPYFVDKERISLRDAGEQIHDSLQDGPEGNTYRIEVEGNEYLIIRDEDMAHDLAVTDIENILDDMGVTAFNESFWRSHVDRDRMIRDFRPDEEEDMQHSWESWWDEDDAMDAVIGYYRDRGSDGDFLSAVISAGADENEMAEYIAEENGEHPDDIGDSFGYIIDNVLGVDAIVDLLEETAEDQGVDWAEIINNEGASEVFPDWDDKVQEKTESLVDEILESPEAWGFEDKLENYVDIDALIEEAIQVDGWAHFVSRYDGNYDETDAGLIIVREN